MSEETPYRLSDHARQEAERREIPLDMLEAVLQSPGQVLEAYSGRKVYQSRVEIGATPYSVVHCRTGRSANGHHGLPHEQDRETLERHPLKVTYDASVDVLRILFSDGRIAESDEDKPGVIIDYDANGNIVGIEILDASMRIGNPQGVEYAVIGLKAAAVQ